VNARRILPRGGQTYLPHRGVARNLFRRETKPGDWGQKSPSGVQGQSPGGGLGAKPPEAQEIYANVLTKNP